MDATAKAPGGVYKTGMLVTHPKRPEWGPGKIVHVIGTKVHVIFRDLAEKEAKTFQTDHVPLTICDVQQDAILDNLPPLTQQDDKWVMPRERITFEHARALFLNMYPGGFDDPNYWGDRHEGERNYKVWAHDHYVKELGEGQAERLVAAGHVSELRQRALSVTGKTNLLSPFEAMALKDALLEEAAAELFFAALLAVLQAERVDKATFGPYLDAVSALPAKQSRVNTWPVATILPYLAQPTRHMFLKPIPTNSAAGALGFDLRYDAAPNWTTYEALLRMGDVYLGLLKPFGARDLIDVQSFIWVTCH